MKCGLNGLIGLEDKEEIEKPESWLRDPFGAKDHQKQTTISYGCLPNGLTETVDALLHSPTLSLNVRDRRNNKDNN